MVKRKTEESFFIKGKKEKLHFLSSEVGAHSEPFSLEHLMLGLATTTSDTGTALIQEESKNRHLHCT